MAKYRKPKHAGLTMPSAEKGVRSAPKPKGYTTSRAGAEHMPIGEGPMNNAAGKVGKFTRLVEGLKKLRGRRTSMAAGKGTDLPTTGGY